MIIDTHTHLYLPEFDPSPENAVDRAVAAGVGMMIFPNVDLSTIEPMQRLHSLRPDSTVMAMGLHPTEITPDFKNNLSVIQQQFNGCNYVAVGEIGIDLYWDSTFRDLQMQAFEIQCQWAVELGLPVIIHCRNGLDEILEVLASLDKIPSGVFHSFGGTPDDVKHIRSTGDFYFGLNGIVTFKNARLADTINEIGADRILLETDSPYLAPVPHRGKRNESAFIVHTCEHVARTLNIDSDTLKNITTESAARLFNLNLLK